MKRIVGQRQRKSKGKMRREIGLIREWALKKEIVEKEKNRRRATITK